jgi:V/A-type H+/Na+-transporting ATPase subunit F
MEIAVIGEQSFVIGFRLAGVKRIYETLPDDKDIEEKIMGLTKDGSLGILIVNDKDVKRLPQSTKHILGENTHPVVIPIGKEDEGDIRERIKRAVGIDLYARK